MLVLAERVLTAAYEVYHGDRESVSKAFIVARIKELDAKMERVLEAHAQVDDKIHQLEKRSQQFAARINEKVNKMATR